MNCTVVKRPSELSSVQRRNVERWKKDVEERARRKASQRKDLGENAFAKALKK